MLFTIFVQNHLHIAICWWDLSHSICVRTYVGLFLKANAIKKFKIRKSDLCACNVMKWTFIEATECKNTNFFFPCKLFKRFYFFSNYNKKNESTMKRSSYQIENVCAYLENIDGLNFGFLSAYWIWISWNKTQLFFYSWW